MSYSDVGLAARRITRSWCQTDNVETIGQQSFAEVMTDETRSFFCSCRSERWFQILKTSGHDDMEGNTSGVFMLNWLSVRDLSEFGKGLHNDDLYIQITKNQRRTSIGSLSSNERNMDHAQQTALFDAVIGAKLL